MKKVEFYEYLKRSGRKPDVSERVIRLVEVYADFLDGSGNRLDTACPEDLDQFVVWVERSQADLPKHDDIQPSANSYLWAIRYYYRFTNDEDLEKYTALLREARIKRKPFAIKDFRGVNSSYAQTLQGCGITNVNQMLKAGKTAEMRRKLSSETGIPESAIEEFVRLSDLARLTGVKAIRARLYHDAGIGSIARFAALEPEEILSITRKFVEDAGFDGIPPLPGEVRHGSATARSLPIITDLD